MNQKIKGTIKVASGALLATTMLSASVSAINYAEYKQDRQYLNDAAYAIKNGKLPNDIDGKKIEITPALIARYQEEVRIYNTLHKQRFKLFWKAESHKDITE